MKGVLTNNGRSLLWPVAIDCIYPSVDTIIHARQVRLDVRLYPCMVVSLCVVSVCFSSVNGFFTCNYVDVLAVCLCYLFI